MIILNLFSSNAAQAAITVSNVAVSFGNDADGNGIYNRGDTMTITCVAFFTAPTTAWTLQPTADLTSIGMGFANMTANGNVWTANVPLANFNQAVQYGQYNINVSAQGDDTAMVTAPSNPDPFVDICQVEGGGATVSPTTANAGDVITISITDSKYQATPLGGTICTVDLGINDPLLGNLMGNTTTPMTHIGGGVFRTTYTIPQGAFWNGPLTITLNDPMLGHPAVNYQTNSILVDGVGPVVDNTNTTVVIQSGNATAVPGDVLRLTAAVTSYDGETVTAGCTSLPAAAANPPLNPAYPMPLITSNGPGNPATWQLDVVLKDADVKNGSLPIIFTFTDDEGNVTTVTRYISIDLDAPNVASPIADIFLPDGTNSTLDTATMSCQLRFTAVLSSDIEPDTLTATIDLSEIGASAQYPMTRVGVSDTFRANYTIPQGNLEDVIDYEFVISVRDLAGNLVAQSAAPPIRIDNKPPTISNVLITSSNPDNASIIRVGDELTIECTVTDIENGSASVDLTRLGIATPHTLYPMGSNIYRGTWVLPNASESLVVPPAPTKIDGYNSFAVYANDTVNGNLVGHIVTAYTNQMMVDNEPPEIVDTAFRSDRTDAVATATLIIGDNVKFYARVFKAPVTVTINMLQFNQGNAENMWPSTHPDFPPDQDWYEYILPGNIPEGLIDGAPKTFRVTATDDAGNTDTADITTPVNIDNKPVKVSDFDINVTYRNDPPDDTDISIINLNKEVEFTVNLDSSTAVSDLGTATIDLSDFGGFTDSELMTYVIADHAFNLPIDNNTKLNYDYSYHRFVVTITDKSGNKTTAQSAQRRVDNWPPTFNASPSANVVGGGSTARIGDSILFRADISNNESVAPEIDLSNLGLSSAQQMSLISTTSGVSRYEYTATISAGTSNGTDTSWIVTARDNDLNYTTDTTGLLTVDSQTPEVALDLTVTGNSQVELIREGEDLTFTLRLASDTSIASDGVTIDLRMIGINNANYQMTNTETYGTGSLWIANVTTQTTTSEYTDVRFTATITDKAGNSVTSNSQLFSEIDCRPVIINDSGLLLYQDNGIVNSGFAGPGDVVMIWASATYHEDAVISGNLATDSPVVDYATATLVYNATNNRHEGTITIATDTVWPEIAGNLQYRVRAVDNVENISSTSYAICADFVVRNSMPTTLSAGINLSPNYPLATTSSNLLVYNLASSTIGDGLIASITFANDLIVHKAWLDFREFGTGTVDLKTDNSSSAVTVSGYAVNRLPAIEDGDSRRVWLYAMDEAGNATYTSERLYIDNVAPTLNSAEFDGDILTVNLSENFDNNTFYVKNWQIVGSSTLGAPEHLTFNATAPAITLDWSSFQLTLDISHQQIMSEWASTPIYLKVTNDNATSAVTDMWGNELRPVEYFPITITDSSWREPARVTLFTMNQDWPNSITLDLLFSKPMDADSLVATRSVLLLATDTTGTFENNVDYNLGYVFQASSTNPLASDTFAWQSPTHLRITLCESGRRWVARKLSNDPNVNLFFAGRHHERPFVYDFLGKPVAHIPASSPLQAVDNRPVSGFAFKGPPNDPKLSIGDRSLVLSATDLLLLSNGNYNSNEDVPYLIEPQLNYSNRATGFHNKIILHESNSGNSQVLELAPLATGANALFASSTVTLHLTGNDLTNILNLFQANPNPVWEMTIPAGSFNNLWGTPNLAYLPSDYPGSMIVATGTPLSGAALAAISMNDLPPVTQKNAGDLSFEIEVFPPDIDGTPLPLQYQATPSVGIFLQNASNTWVASGTCTGYSERTVDGRLRGVFSYQNTSDLPDNLQSVPALINIYNVTDIFGNSYDLTGSYSYDLGSKNDSVLGGFSAASAAIVFDTQKPTVDSIIPHDYIGKIPAGSIFRVNFDEEMNTSVIPTLSLATSTQAMTFSFSGWSATATAEFTNDADFTASMPNGIWYYQVTAGTDLAGNVMETTGTTAFPVQVRTYAPEVVSGNIIMRTVQNTISTAELINQPWSRYVGTAVFSVEYTNAPTQNLPHYLEIYDPVSNVQQGKVVLTISGNLATATFSAVSAGKIGPTDFAARVVDSLYNRTDNLLTVVYDGLPPSITSFDCDGLGIGSSTADTTYFRPLNGDLQLDIVATTTDALKLAIYDGTATTTQALYESGVAGTYFLATGSNLVDGTYTFTIVDLAGNIGTGSASRQVVADSVAPTLTSIVPEYSLGDPAPYSIGKCAASETKLVVSFSEPMDADPAQVPVLSLSDGSSTINWRFVNWLDPDIATAAIYENIGDITSSHSSGQYNFTLSGGRDLAGNAKTPEPDTTQTITLYTAGPNAKITTYTNQSHVYGTSPQTNLGYNPAYGSATMQIDFVGVMTEPYELVMASGSTVVATYNLAADGSTPKFAYLEPPGYGSWIWLDLAHPTDASYTLYVRDSAGDRSPEVGFRFDTISPTIDTDIAMTTGPGIATSTEYGYDVLYHSPAVNDATINITTTNPDVIRLFANNGIDSYFADMAPGLYNHSALWSALSPVASMPDGLYVITAVDTAGNVADGVASTAMVMIDTDEPELVSAVSMFSGTPATSTGAIATGTGVFWLTFDSGMNTAVTPTLTLASDSVSINMVATGGVNGWVSSSTCQFTNTVAIDKSFTPGTYSYIISGAQDYAGNTSITTEAGSFTVVLFTEEPDLTSYQVTSQQTALYNTQTFVNRPLSFETYAADPDIATLTIGYRTSGGHPYQLPHLIQIYDSSETMVSSTIMPGVISGSSDFTLTSTNLGNPGAATESYSFRLVDSIGNVSVSYSIPIVYDGIRPTLAVATFSNFSDAISDPLYYNEQLHGPLSAKFEASASTATDSLVLVIAGAATYTWNMDSNLTSGISTFSVAVASASSMAEGDYLITAADMAGNFANGAASTTRLVVDRTAPTVTLATTTSGLPIVSAIAEGATFTIQFDEDMNELASATPTLVIATTTAQIACTFKGWTASDTAQFVNTSAISNSLPQGDYDCKVIAWDLTGNKLETNNAGTLVVRSRGPIVTAFTATSYQSTTASGAETLINQPISFIVDPKAATLSIELAQAPDSDPTQIWLHFMLDASTTVASYPLPLIANNATFTWATGTEPMPVLATTYTMRVADAAGDFSLESFNWRNDSVPPEVQTLLTSNAENATGSVYFSPSRHRYVSISFNTIESEAPKLRIRSENSTDTYELSSSITNQWSTNFEGRYSRDGNARMPDGTYALDMVDRAGNVALLASDGLPISFNLIIDSVAPGISTYTLSQNSLPVTSFAPGAGDLEIIVTPEDLVNTSISEEDLWWIEVLDNTNTRVKRLPMSNASGTFHAYWDGSNDSGSLVLDGNYTLVATDYAGNRATLTTEVFARTTPFRVTAIEQVSSNSARIWFNHDIDEASWVGWPNAIVASPPLAISDLARDQERAITFTVTPAFEHGISYIFTVATDTITSIYGAHVAENARTAILIADGRGPVLSGVSFHGLAGQQEFRVEFDENYTAASAGNKTNYTLVSASGAVTIANAVTQSDLRSVILTADPALVENASYTVTASNIFDSFGNATSSAYAFKGRDLTPPVLTVSAFSNPANENDIIVVVTTNETLEAAPTLTVAQSNAPTITTVMQQGAEPTSYMMGVSLSPSYAGNGTLSAEATDLAGNTGYGTNTFVVAYVSSLRASVVLSADSRLTLNFNEQSLKNDATVRILQHNLEKSATSDGAIKTSLQQQFRAAIGSLRASAASATVSPNHNELVPVSMAYEIGIAKNKVDKGFSVSLKTDTATDSHGIALFNQVGDNWNFVTASRDKEGAFAARTGSPQIFAIMRDIAAPRLSLAADMQLSEPFRTARPEFRGNIEEAGSGLDPRTVIASIDDGPSQPVKVDSNGNFVFVPIADLVAGDHQLVIKAADRTGNTGLMAATRFSVVMPLSISQIIQYPNPANRRMFIRISANRKDLSSGLVTVKIYDVAGHKVAELDYIKAVSEKWGANERYLYDIPWDLRNRDGKIVANGVYFARIVVRDPDNPSIKTKRNFKLAVLR